MSRTLLLCVEITPAVWCFIDYWWSTHHLLTNLSLMKCCFFFLHLGTRNSTLLYNYWQLNHSAASQTSHLIAFAIQVFRNICSLHKELCIQVNGHTHAHPNFRFSITSINIEAILGFQRVFSCLSKISCAEMYAVLQRLSERIEFTVPGWKQHAHSL